ncbi:hypothetical protein JZ751_027062 [Albula glossodonta]|uniref:Chemokine interleukin-8-like domain-containing protein n=1 Tax=Albula glossodonta TaxID=121402 RepID=A0A8T2NGN8_9TELE|nr:hypothetical protein JZ751_027062 [Albula glossodonta]
MKTAFIFFAVLLCLHHISAQPAALHAPTDCCFVFFKGKIPSANIMTVNKIDSNCPKPGFIVTTVKNKRFCLDQTFQVEASAKGTE